MNCALACPCCNYVAEGESTFGTLYLLIEHTKKLAHLGNVAHLEQLAWLCEQLKPGDHKKPLAVSGKGEA